MSVIQETDEPEDEWTRKYSAQSSSLHIVWMESATTPLDRFSKEPQPNGIVDYQTISPGHAMMKMYKSGGPIKQTVLKSSVTGLSTLSNNEDSVNPMESLEDLSKPVIQMAFDALETKSKARVDATF